MLLLALLEWTAFASEVEAPWYVGLPVYQVSLEAPEGGLPEENLEPLLRVHQGELLNPQDVRQDIALLYRAGDFSSVEAFAESWIDVDYDGNPVPAVRLAYVVRSPARILDVEVDGVRGAARKVATRAMALDLGQPFYPERDIAAATERVRDALEAEGWPAATVRLDADVVTVNDVALKLTVDPGESRVLGRVVISGPRVVAPGDPRFGDGAPTLRRNQVNRWLRRSGIRVGHRVPASASTEARASILDRLYELGWMDPRVSLVFLPGSEHQGGETLLVQVETGQHLAIATRGKGMPGDSALKDVLGLSPGDLLSPGGVDEARGRLEQWYRSEGYSGARVEIGLASDEISNHLEVFVDRGPRHVLRRVRVRGAETFNQRYVAGAFVEAQPETLGRRIYSPDAVKSAMATLREFYRGQGFVDATVSIDDRIKTSRPRWLFPFKPLAWGVAVDVTLTVVEGPRTVLASLTTVGGIGIENDLLAERLPELVGRPFRPVELEKLTQQVVDAYRSHGYLNVDVKLDTTTRLGSTTTTPTAVAQLQVTPGQQIRLRGVIIQGNQRTRRRIVEREIALSVGDPITPEAISQTRSQLYNLELFRLVSPELIGDDDRSRDLLIRLEERPNLLFELGGGASTDEGLRVRGSASHRNLGGIGHRVTALGQVGYGWTTDLWRPDFNAPVWRAALRYQAPEFLRHAQQLVVEAVLNEVVSEPTYRLSSRGASAGLRATRGAGEYQLGYRGQWRQLQYVDAGALVIGDPWRSFAGLGATDGGNARLPSDPRLVSGPQFQALIDKRDNRLDPRKGLVVAGQVGINDTLLGDPFMVRGTARAEQLIPTGPLILAVVGNAGAGWAAGKGVTLPIEDRFYLGGGDTLRGFQLDTVGPANFSARPAVDFPEQIAPIIEGMVLKDHPDHWVPTGGDSMVAGSLEIRVPVSLLGVQSDGTWAVAFTDVGHVGFLDPGIQTSSMAAGDPWLRFSVGGGLRLASPVGPASLVVGLNPAPLRDERTLQLHFSLGAL